MTMSPGADVIVTGTEHCSICKDAIDAYGAGPRPGVFVVEACELSNVVEGNARYFWLAFSRHNDCAGPLDLRTGKIIR